MLLIPVKKTKKNQPLFSGSFLTLKSHFVYTKILYRFLFGKVKVEY